MENNRSFYNEILTDHNLHPMHKHPLDTATASLEGVNPSCYKRNQKSMLVPTKVIYQRITRVLYPVLNLSLIHIYTKEVSKYLTTSVTILRTVTPLES